MLRTTHRHAKVTWGKHKGIESTWKGRTMFKTRQMKPNQIETRIGGKISAQEMARGFDTLLPMTRKLVDGKVLLIYDDIGLPEPAALVEEMNRLPQLFEALTHLKKIAVLSDHGWIRKAAEYEGMALSGVCVRAYPTKSRNLAEAFLNKADETCEDEGDFFDNFPV